MEGWPLSLPGKESSPRGRELGFPLTACGDLGHVTALWASVPVLYVTRRRWTRFYFSLSFSPMPGTLMPVTPSGPCNSPGKRSGDPILQMFALNLRFWGQKDLGLPSASVSSLCVTLDKSLSLSEPPRPHLCSREDTSYLSGCCDRTNGHDAFCTP